VRTQDTGRPPAGPSEDTAQATRAVVDKAFTVLEAWRRRDEVLGVSELARRTGLPKSTSHRLLGLLEAAGVVERGAAGHRLGDRLHGFSALLSADSPPELREVSLPNLPLSVPTYYVVAPAEASSNLARFDGVRYGYRCKEPRDLLDLYKRSRGEGFGPEVKRRIMTGTYVLSAGYYDAYYLRAQKVRQLITDDFRRAFAEVDVLMGPMTPTAAFAIGAKTDDPIAMYLNDIYTIGANLAGVPAMSVPCGFVAGLPVGLQIVGPHFGEAKLLNVAHRYQLETDWHTRVPQGYA